MLRCAASFVIASYAKSTPHSSVFARLAAGARVPFRVFYEASQYEFICIRFCLIMQTLRLYPKAVNYATYKYVPKSILKYLLSFLIKAISSRIKTILMLVISLDTFVYWPLY